MARKMLAAVVVLLSLASVSRAESLFEVLTSGVKAVASGTKKVVENANPAKIVSDTVDGTVEAGQKAGEVTVGGAANTVGVVSKAAGNR
jgi:hypothetical protein